MVPLRWFIGLWLPACGASGARGLPTPMLLDFANLQRPSSPNTALAAPAGNQPVPDLTTPLFGCSATHLFAALMDVARTQPRTFVAAVFPTERQAHFVARSAVCNFPDLIAGQVFAVGPATSGVALYSRSVYGYSDLGMNRRRLAAWVAALQSRINHPSER